MVYYFLMLFAADEDRNDEYVSLDERIADAKRRARSTNGDGNGNAAPEQPDKDEIER